MKKINLLFLVALLATQLNMFGVNTETRLNISGLELPQLIITEVRQDAEGTAYVELTNLGDTAIDLAPFDLHSVHFNTRLISISDSMISFNRANEAVDNTLGKVYLQGVVQPGESYVVSTAWDADFERGLPRHNIAIAQLSGQVVHKNEEFNEDGWIDMPLWECYGRDSVYSGKVELLRAEQSAGYLLHWHFMGDSIMDSTYIDQFNVYIPAEGGSTDYAFKAIHTLPIAGVEEAVNSSVMVRKAQITKGNMNWEQSRGTDASNSEWLVVPKNSSRVMAFTTVGNHGAYDLDYTVKDANQVIIDENAKTMSIPYQIARGDSLANYFNLGDGMSWSYTLNDVFEDTASYIARTGDMFALYALGEEVKMEEYTLTVREAETNLAAVFPVRDLIFDEEITVDEVTGEIDTLYTRRWSTGFRYDVTSGLDVDSIVDVPFALRTDTLLKYLDKPENATWEFDFVDGQQRVDLMFGDILRVTSEDRTVVKEYVISVEEHVLQSNALLTTVTWPDIDPDVYWRWDKGDTLPEFSTLKTDYIVELDFAATQIPAFQFKPADLRASFEVMNAVDIDGNAAQRTTSVVVLAEDDSTTLTYNFTFVRKGTPVQPNEAEPFISEMVWNVNTQGCAVEIFNPGTEEIDLHQYMYVAGKTTQTWQEAVETLVSQAQFTSGDGLKCYQTHYNPGSRWTADGSEDEWIDPTDEDPLVGRGFLRNDNQTDTWVDAQDVWVMGVGTSTAATQVKIRAESDFIFRGASADETVFAWDSTKILHRETPIWNDPRHNMWLLKVLNDSILDGTMNVRNADQYELIDRFEIINDTIAGRKCTGKNWTLRRKSSVTKGNLEKIGGGLSTPESSEWIVFKSTDDGYSTDAMVANVGLHVMDPITNYLSTVTSMYFHVTSGYSGSSLTITGDIVSNTPTSISTLLDKADDSQTFVFMRGAVEVAADQALADGDVLSVTSGDASSTTVYTLVNAPLDANTALTAVSGSGLTVTGTKVSGMAVGTTVKDLLTKVEVASTSILNVVDANGALQPLTVHNLDTLVYDVLVSNNILLEVVAENSDKATYSLDFGLASNEALLFSNILPIDQDEMMIMDLPYASTAPSMLTMVFASEGATVKILDKAGFERVQGFLNIDDVVEVTAADGTTKVIYTFYNEKDVTGIFSVKAPSLSIELFPNPVSDVLNFRGVEVASVSVYSLSGAMMINQSTYSNSLNVSSLPKGIYMIRTTDMQGEVSINRFLKK